MLTLDADQRARFGRESSDALKGLIDEGLNRYSAVCGYLGAHYAHQPSPFRSALDRMPSYHANPTTCRDLYKKERERN